MHETAFHPPEQKQSEGLVKCSRSLEPNYWSEVRIIEPLGAETGEGNNPSGQEPLH